MAAVAVKRGGDSQSEAELVSLVLKNEQLRAERKGLLEKYRMNKARVQVQSNELAAQTAERARSEALLTEQTTAGIEAARQEYEAKVAALRAALQAAVADNKTFNANAAAAMETNNLELQRELALLQQQKAQLEEGKQRLTALAERVRPTLANVTVPPPVLPVMTEPAMEISLGGGYRATYRRGGSAEALNQKYDVPAPAQSAPRFGGRTIAQAADLERRRAAKPTPARH